MEKKMESKEDFKDIKDTLELIDGFEIIIFTCMKVLIDGKINMSDLPVILDLLKEAGKIIEAVRGVSNIPDEIRDIDQSEAAEIGFKIYEIVDRIKREIQAAEGKA